MKLIDLSQAKRVRETVASTAKGSKKVASEPGHLYHEIANQLSVIALSSFLLRKDLQETLSEKQREQFLKMERTVERLREMISGLPKVPVVSRAVSDNPF